MNGVYNWDPLTGGYNTRVFPHSFLLEIRLARPYRRLDITVAFFKNYIVNITAFVSGSRYCFNSFGIIARVNYFIYVESMPFS